MDIKIINVKKSYNDKIVLDIDRLNIMKGKIVGLIGPNGAGKSTLINIVAGLDRNFSGKVKYDGRDLDKSIYRQITLVTQRPYLFRRTVYENIAYPLKVRGVDKDEIKIRTEEILEKFNIHHLKDEKAHLLSGGESQRVALARGLVFKPRLLLLDEPTSNIDPDAIDVMEREIVKFNREEKSTILIITHNMSQGKKICDELIYLDARKVDENDI